MEWQKGVAIGIPTYNGVLRVKALLKNLRQRLDPQLDVDLVVVDDSGRQEHQNAVKQVCQEYGAKYIFHEKNSGVPTGWNNLTRSTNRECMVLLNDDVLMAKDAIENLYYAVMANPKVGTFGLNFRFITMDDCPKILESADSKVIPLNVRYENGVLIRNERFASLPPEGDDNPGRVMCPTGCGFGFRRETFEAVGGFDQRYFAFYEETDFGVSCALKGLPSFTLPIPMDSYHLWSATFGSAPEVPASKIMLASKAKFVEKWSKILGVTFQDAPELHNLLMDKIPLFEVKWMGAGHKERSAVL